MVRSSVVSAFLISCVGLPLLSHANIVQNGSFEVFGGSGNSNIGAGISPWTIGGGGIDIVQSATWQAADGNVSITLGWTAASSVTQTLTTVAGQAYEIRFSMAAEIFGGSALRTMNVRWNGATVGSPSFQYAGQGPTSMGWTEFAYVVQGTGSDVLSFVSTTTIQPNYGPAIDNVSVIPVTVCDSIDFNNDTSLFDPQDIDAFLSVYGEGPCIPQTATCNDIDFNNDGSVFDPCDIDSFLTQFAEGPCTLCGQ